MFKKMLCFTLTCMLALAFSVSAFANSAQMYWSGESGSGLISTNKKSPLQVKNEVLTFDLEEFPENYYPTVDEFVNYSGKVTAKYTIHNPSNQTITSKLAFPFGSLPAYDFKADFEYDKIPRRYDEMYQILINETEVEKKLRHTFSYGFSAFDYKDDSEKICDNFKKDDFYSPNTPVKVYVFEPSGIPDEFKENAFASASFSLDAGKTRVLLADCAGHEEIDYKTVDAGLYVENGIAFTMYVIGEDIKELPEWKVYGDYMLESEISGKVKLLFTDDWTFKDVALMFHGADSGVSETDWYNASVDKLNNLSYYTGFLGSDLELMLSDSLMQWFEYEITLKAGETIENTVTAPIYPTINSGFNPTIYDYTYFISPAKSWASFGKIDVVINTPYYVTECALGEPKKVDGGYAFTIESLPENELFFTLCTSKNPKEDFHFELDFLHISLIFYGVLASIVIIVILLPQKRKKKTK